MSVLDFLTHRQNKKVAAQASAHEQYRSLLEAFVDGDEVDVETADEIIAAVDKTETELQADVENLQKRRQWAAQVEAWERAQDVRPKAEAEVAAHRQAIDDLIAKLQPKIDAALALVQDANQKEIIAMDAKNKLVQSCTDPSILQPIELLVEERKELHPLILDLEERLKKAYVPYYESRVANLRREKAELSKLDQAGHARTNRELRAELDQLEAATEKADRIKAELIPLRKRFDECTAEIDELTARKLIP